MTRSVQQPEKMDHSNAGAQVIEEVDAGTHGVNSADRVGPQRKRRGRSDLSMEETVMLLREVFASKAHVAPHGSKLELFDKAADALTLNSDFTPSLDGKSVRDRYERLQRTFNKKDKKDAMLSGVGGEITEADELLSQMEEARVEQAAQRSERREEVNQREQRKLVAGARIVDKAMSAAAVISSGDEGQGSSDADGARGSDEEHNGTSMEKGSGSAKKKKRRLNHGARFEGEMDRFGALLREGDQAQRDLDEKKLLLEERRMEMEERRRLEEREERRLEREADREERAADRVSRERVELEKFKLMMEMLQNQSK